jgi:hypothetical protein
VVARVAQVAAAADQAADQVAVVTVSVVEVTGVSVVGRRAGAPVAEPEATVAAVCMCCKPRDIENG